MESVRTAIVRCLAVATAVVCLAVPARAEVVFNWGSPVYSTFRDSFGNELDANYTFELGVFDPSFTPGAGNVTSWAANWKVFDQANFNVFAETFASTVDMLDNGTSSSLFAEPGYDFRGLDAYVWGYNAKSYVDTLEWVWFRAPSWVFPVSVTPGPPITPTDWSISDLVAGDIPLWGAQSTAIGLGYASAPGVYDLQLYTLNIGPEPIPEPSTISVAALLLAFAVWRRWKTSRAASVAALLAALMLLPLSGQANRINFYSTPGQPAYGSDGRPLDSETSFELGVFANGFVPTAINTAEWSAHWVPAQRTKFSGNHTWFTSVFNVTNNAAPFTVGAPAYVWGFSGSEEQGQWILFRSTKWTWPAADATAPAPLLWSSKDADVVVVGALPSTGVARVALRPTAIANSLPPATTWNQWKTDKLAGQPLGNPNDDADGDGVPNILEFVLGTSPSSAADRPTEGWGRMQVAPEGGKSYLELRVPRRRDRPAKFTAQVSSDLNTWASGTSHTRVVSDTADAMTVRDAVPIGEAGNARFLRVNVAPQ